MFSLPPLVFTFFFFNDTATTEIYTLSLHDALPIYSALGRLLVVVENYPQLKSNENFMRLQDELAGTENRIAVERKRYNDTLQDYNTYVQQFPHNIFANWAGFKPNSAYFAASEGSRQVPKVNFSTPSAT